MLHPSGKAMSGLVFSNKCCKAPIHIAPYNKALAYCFSYTGKTGTFSVTGEFCPSFLAFPVIHSGFLLRNLQGMVAFVLQDIFWASVGNHSLFFQREKLRLQMAEVIQDHKFRHRCIYAECFLFRYPDSLLTSSIIYGVFGRETGGSMTSENQNLCGDLLWGLLKTVNTTNK